MNRNIIWFVVLFLVILLGVFAFWGEGEEVVTENGEQPSDKELAESVGKIFINDLLAIAPPSDDDEAKERMLESLSQSALEKIDTETFSRDMALFAGIQDIPDQGVEFEEIDMKSDSSATLVVELKYSGGSAYRDVHLTIEDGEWKVDSITERRVSDFNKTGNIVRDNPGYPEGVWVFTYEEPGSPALWKVLSFTDNSICINEEETVCNPDELSSGSRVSIEGIEREDEVEVVTLKHTE